MTIIESDEAAALREAARQFVQARCNERLCLEWDQAGSYPKHVFDQIAALGWYGIGIPETEGGVGGGAAELLVVAEELGRGSTDLVACYSLTVSGLRNLIANGNEQQTASLVPALMAGTSRLSIGITEPEAGSDAASLRTTARREGDHYVVNGQKTFCEAAALPGTLVQLYVRTDPAAPKHRGISMLLLDPDSPGVTLSRLPMMGRNITGLYEVFLDDVKIPAANMVGEENRAWHALSAELPLERLVIAAGFVGATFQVLEDTLRHVKGREQFGSRLGDFQAVSHSLVDLFTRASAAQLLVQHGGALHDAGHSYIAEVSMAKIASSELYADATRLAIQLHGGYGYIREHPLTMHYADSVISTVAGGASQIQRGIVGKQLGLKAW
jgi:alkylation response protein AidB-like acyl-CoA dehydrogenase